MDRSLIRPLILLGVVILPSAATDELQFDLQPPFSSIELYADEVLSMRLKVTGITCSPQVDTGNGNVRVSREADVKDSTQGGMVVDYGNNTDVIITGYDVTTRGYDVTTPGNDVTSTGNDAITLGNDVTLVNLTYTIDSTGHDTNSIQESHILLSNVSDVNTQVEFSLTHIGYVTITVTVTWICQNQTHTANSTYHGIVKKIPFVSAQTGLR